MIITICNNKNSNQKYSWFNRFLSHVQEIKENVIFYDIGDMSQKWKPSTNNMVNILFGFAE